MDRQPLMTEQPELISLADLIDQIKSDLRRGERSDPALFIDGIEVTAQVVVSRNKTEGGKTGVGLNLSVIGFKADAGINTQTALGSEMTQSVTIKLSPLLDKADYLAQLDETERIKLEQDVAKIATRGKSTASANPI